MAAGLLYDKLDSIRLDGLVLCSAVHHATRCAPPCMFVCRYAKSQRAQLLGQAFGLPVFMAAFTFAGLAVTSGAWVGRVHSGCAETELKLVGAGPQPSFELPPSPQPRWCCLAAPSATQSPC